MSHVANDVIKKIGAFTLCSDDEVMSNLVAQPLADILAAEPSVDIDRAVENFLSNPELFGNFTQVLDEVWESDSTARKTMSASNYFATTLSTPPHHTNDDDYGNDFSMNDNENPGNDSCQLMESSHGDEFDASSNSRALPKSADNMHDELAGNQRPPLEASNSRPESSQNQEADHEIDVVGESPGSEVVAGVELKYENKSEYQIKVLLPLLSSDEVCTNHLSVDVNPAEESNWTVESATTLPSATGEQENLCQSPPNSNPAKEVSLLVETPPNHLHALHSLAQEVTTNRQNDISSGSLTADSLTARAEKTQSNDSPGIKTIKLFFAVPDLS